MSAVWAYVAHKDGYWAGVASSELQGIGSWIGKFIKAGFTVSSVKDRDEYDATLKDLKPWHDSPEYKAKHPPKKQKQ